MDWGSGAFEAAEFVRLVEAGDFPGDKFHHGDHIRLAWIYVETLGAAAAEERIRVSILKFATNLNHPEKYHDTMTRAWLRLVAVGHAIGPQTGDFPDFIAQHRWLLNRDALSSFYSKPHLMSDAARQGWVGPDLKELPRV
jgi:hypothetical protein